MSDTLNNDFIRLVNIGKGTFGTVYKGYSLSKGNHFAIKKINDENKFRKCALNEIKILTYLETLRNDNFPIVKFYDDFIENNIQYLVFEYLDMNLYIYHKKNSFNLDINTILNITSNICLGLKYIHTKYIHNDLKPENIMINSLTNQIKIIDLGSALDKDKPKTYFYYQSRYYRSPEVIFELQFNEKIDIWSLGCIVCELIIGKPIFQGRNIKDLLFKICEKIDIPIEEKYLFSKCHIKYFSKLLNDEIITYEYLDKDKYSKPEYCLELYLNKYLSEYNLNKEFEKNLVDFIKNILVYDFNIRPTAEDCINQLKLFHKNNIFINIK